MTRFIRSISLAALILVFAVPAFPGPSQADALSDLSKSLANGLNQSAGNSQGNIQNDLQNSIRSAVPQSNAIVSGQRLAAQPSLNPQTLCAQVPAEMRSKYTNYCSSFDANNLCSMIPIGVAPKTEAQLKSACNTALTLARGQSQSLAKALPPSASPAMNQMMSEQLQNQIRGLTVKH